jgi:soluble lytic murein transglycosylase-like protein
LGPDAIPGFLGRAVKEALMWGALWTNWRVQVIAGMVLVVGMGAGTWFGSSLSSRHQARQHILEGRILEWIVERNPNATLREFRGFVEELFAVSQETGVEWEWILSIAEKESQMRPDAVGAAGEIGLMQILPATGQLIADKIGDAWEPPVLAKGRYTSFGALGDPKKNIRYGATYLKWQRERFKSWATALRAYNRHPDRALERRPHDRYAETVVWNFVELRERFRRGHLGF